MFAWIVFGLSFAFAALTVLAAPAAAQAPRPPAPEEPAADARRGLTFGFGLGAGEISCEDASSTGTGPCDGVTEAGGLDVHVGGMVSPRLAILGELWVMGHTEDELTLTHTIVTAGAQFWLLPRLWIRGGLGAAHARFRYDGVLIDVEDRTQSVPAIMVAAGYEIVTGGRFALDLQLRGGTGFYEDQDTRAHNAALSLGFNWY